MRSLGILLLFTAALAAARPALASCIDTSFDGTYAFSYGKSAGSETATSGMGVVTSNGKGAITGKWVQSSDGTISAATFSGTYTLSEDCAGTMAWTNSTHAVGHFDFDLVNGGKGFEMLRTDSGHAQIGSGSLQGASGCALGGEPQNYVIYLSGTLTAEGKQKVVLGQITANGIGSITGTATVGVNFSLVASALPLTGTYAVNSNCTGTAQIQIHGQSTMNFDTIIVNGGKSIMLFETDAGTLISGGAQE